MSLHPQPLEPVPVDTARVARAAFPKGNVYLRMRDELGRLYEDEAFAALFPARGQPAEAPWRLALVSVMQFAEGLSDRQAADAVRSRLDWKYALSLELTDAGFDASVLSEFRQRLVAGHAAYQLLDAMLARFQACGLLRARGRQRTDSTHVLAAIRALDRLETVGETLRHTLNTLAVVAPAGLPAVVEPAWADRYGPRLEAYRLPKTRSGREALAEQIGQDGFRLLAAVTAPTAPAWLREVPAVETLRQVWVQQYHAPRERVRWRHGPDLPPAARLITSPYDREARYSTKRTVHWVGYKVHLTETCEPDAPHWLTHVVSTPGPTADVAVLPQIHAALAAKDCLPREHLVDSGYVAAATLVSSAQTYGIRVVGPALPESTWQAHRGQGFAVADFVLDWQAQRATCPHGRHSRSWAEARDRHGQAIIRIGFAAADCQGCAARAQCTRAAQRPRQLTVRPPAQHQVLQAARQHQATAAFAAEYAARAGVEGTLAQGLRVADLRRARYVGLAKVRLQHVLTAAGLNLRRLGAWWEERAFAPTRQARFVTLLAATP